MAYHYIIVSTSDPTDSLVINSRRVSEQNKLNSFIFSSDIIQNEFYFCDICKCDVGSKSKHCKACNRCTENFDHHCKWVNNCIGLINYDEFIKLIRWTTIY